MGLTLCRNKGRDKTCAMMRSGDCPFTKAKRSNRDVPDQNELQTYASLEKMLHKAIHVVRQLKMKGNTNTFSALKQQSNSSSLSSFDLKTNVLSSDKSKAVKTTSKTLSTRCFKYHRVGHYANKCQKQKPLVTLEKVETEPEKEDPLPIFEPLTNSQRNNFRVVDSKMFLELVTGRNPVGEFGDGVDIVQRVRKMTDSHKESVVKVLDPRLTSIPLHEVTDVFYVAMLCVEEQAVERPTMREVILESFCS
ncbi:unnamed protein product [Brassica oleracea]